MGQLRLNVCQIRKGTAIKKNYLILIPIYKSDRFIESQIVSILKEQEAGAKVMDICREYGISDATFYNLKAKYGGMAPSHLMMAEGA